MLGVRSERSGFSGAAEPTLPGGPAAASATPTARGAACRPRVRARADCSSVLHADRTANPQVPRRRSPALALCRTTARGLASRLRLPSRAAGPELVHAPEVHGAIHDALPLAMAPVLLDAYERRGRRLKPPFDLGRNLGVAFHLAPLENPARARDRNLVLPPPKGLLYPRGCGGFARLVDLYSL